MAETNKRPRYNIYDYAIDKTFVPREGQILYFENVETFIKNILSVIGDGTNQIQNMPFREIINIETSIAISLNSLRISGNKVIIQNTSTSGKLIDLGTPSSHYYYDLQPNVCVMMKFNGTEWVLLIDAIKGIYIDADYTIQNEEVIYYYKVNTNTNKEVNVVLPLFASNQGKEPFIIQNVGNGIVRVLRQGGDTINGFMTELRLYTQDNYVEIYPRPTGWSIRSQHVTLDSGRVNTSDWTLRSLGFANVDYDTVTVGAPRIGGIVIGGTSGATGKIINYNATTLFLAQVTGGGIFTNNETITGSGFSFTALVNEPTGSNKNKDTFMFVYQMGVRIQQIEKRFIIYFTDDNNNYVEPHEIAMALLGSTDNYGAAYFFITNDSIGMRTSLQGYSFISYGGGRTVLDVQDYYYRHFFDIKY